MHFITETGDKLAEALELVMDELLDGILIVNDLTRKVTYCNNKFIRMWNIPLEIVKTGDDHALLNNVVMQLKEPEKFLNIIEALHGTDAPWKDEIHFKDGQIFARKSIALKDGQGHQFRAWIFRDVTKQKDINLDSLTGCLNRREWDSLLKRDDFFSYNKSFSVVAVIDLNDFKVINDDFGHEAGDRILKRLGETLHRMIRSDQDKIFRTGGDEFCMILESNSDIDLTEPISHRLSNELIAAGINAAIGVCMSSPRDKLIDVFKKADARMLAAKKSEQEKTRFVHPTLPSSIRKTKTDTEIEMLANLAVAIKKNELSLIYQPIYDQEYKIAWVEALCRWKHDGVEISPAVFIPLSETSDLIHRIWDWGLEQAVKSIRTWQNEGLQAAPISLNFSAVQVEYHKNSGFSYANQIQEICEKHHTCPSQIKIELTETSLLNDLLKAKELFDELTALGVDLCIDDFGTGFSSLSIIQALPIKYIKIDGSFIKGVPTNLANTAITKGAIAMANELGLEVCAECVESADQIEFLNIHGCQYVQGFFKSEPVSAAAIGSMLAECQ